MTKRDFFILLLKVVGLFLLLSNVFTAIPSLATYIAMYETGHLIILALAVALIIIGLFVLLVQKADRLVDWLNLTKGFDEDRIEFGNLDRKNLIALASMLFGGYLIVSAIPNILTGLISAFYSDINYIPFTLTDKVNLAIEGAYAVIGYLLITNAHRVSNWMINKGSGLN